MIDEVIGRQTDDLHRQAQRLVVHGCIHQCLEHAGAKASSHDALLERHDQLLAACVALDQVDIEWFGVARVDDAHRPAVRGKSICDFDTARDDRPEAHDQDLVALAHDLGLAYRDWVGGHGGEVEA